MDADAQPETMQEKPQPCLFHFQRLWPVCGGRTFSRHAERHQKTGGNTADGAGNGNLHPVGGTSGKRQSGETAPKPPSEPNCRGRNCSLSAVFRLSLSDAAAFGGRYSSGGARAAGDYDHVCHARHKQRAAFAAAEISAAAKQGHHPNAAGLCLYLHYYRAGLLEPPSRRII